MSIEDRGAEDKGLRDGPPWEDKSRPDFERWKETVKGVLTNPSDFFSTMRVGGGIVDPLIFGVIGGTLGSGFLIVWNLLLGEIEVPKELGALPPGVDTLLVGGMSMFCGLALAPFFIIISFFIAAGIIHLMLMLLGAAKQPFEATFRVIAYTQGAILLVYIIPACGALIAGIWVLIAQIIGISKVQETSIGIAAAAVLLPFLVCCGCVLIPAIFAGIGLAAGKGTIGFFW